VLSLSKPAISHTDAALGDICSYLKGEKYKAERGSSFIAGTSTLFEKDFSLCMFALLATSLT